MALFSQNMLELAFEITTLDPTYEPMIMKFAEHFYYIGSAMNKRGSDGMWDEEDGFYYDLLRLPDGSAKRLRVRSMVGLLPLCATTIIEKSMLANSANMANAERLCRTRVMRPSIPIDISG
jgi:hypothetical protein